jgi:hypothetical protein
LVQQCDGPVFIGVGDGNLDCECGNRLIERYDPNHFLAVGLQCQRCGHVTTTPGLGNNAIPPFAVIIAEPGAEPRTATTTLTKSAYIIGRAEMDRISALYSPVTPPDFTYVISPSLLDEAVAAYERITGQTLPTWIADLANPLVRLKDHAFAWAVQHMRARMKQDPWRCMDDIPTPIAVVTITGFLHFVATWSHHPLFPAMVAGAAAHGFSVHGLAPFAAAHCATMMGNRISFPAPAGEPRRINGFNLATGPTDIAEVHIDIFDRFEVPFGKPWDPASLRAAVGDHIAASQGRINPRNPGLLMLSPGIALLGFDEALIQAIRDVLQGQGRRHKGLMAVAPVVLRLQPMPDPHAVRLCYGFFPIANKHYAGDTELRIGS